MLQKISLKKELQQFSDRKGCVTQLVSVRGKQELLLSIDNSKQIPKIMKISAFYLDKTVPELPH